MDKMIHPVSGEYGYFCTNKEKKIIDVALEYTLANQDSKEVVSRSVECGA